MQAINIYYPITKGNDGFFKKTYSNIDAIRSKVHVLFKTIPGERPFNPDFGLSLHKYLFYPSNIELEDYIKGEIEDKIEKYIPEINLDSIKIERYENEISINISYHLKSNLTIENNITISVK